MPNKRLQEILPFVRHPSRYLGSETNRIKKDLRRVDLRFALAFPDLYEIGTSHFGMQILYSILNGQPDIAAERVFAPAPDMEQQLRDRQMPLLSLESHKPLKEFDIVGFSLLYELNNTNILTMLDLSSIPFYADQRDASDPVVIAGGPCACNPEPIADFFDALVIGDGEDVILEMAGRWLEINRRAAGDKNALLDAWAQIRGVYIPTRFDHQRGSGKQRSPSNPKEQGYRIQRAVVANIDSAPFPTTPIVPFGRPVHDRLRMEIARGCTRGCRFCQAGMIYRPVRERSLKTITQLSETSLRTTGYEDLSLLSLSTGDYSTIGPLLDGLMNRCKRIRTAVSLPSLRVDSMSPQLMDTIRKVRKTGFTFAPEAGSQRLRDVINKNIRQEDIETTVADAFRLGWQVVKLYFMIGLPTETETDLQEIVDLVKRLNRLKNRGHRRGKLNVSLTTFVPKPHTPFQWASQLSLQESQKRIAWLKDRLTMQGVHVKYQHPAVSQIEGLWSRGDRHLSKLLISAYQHGCRLDGWSDHFDLQRWLSACDASGIRIEDYTTRCRDVTEPLPWDHIDIGVSKQYLIDEWQNALSGVHTADCRFGQCNQCGVCDFDALAPVTNTPASNRTVSSANQSSADAGTDFQTVELTYSKLDQARYYGHLELVNIFIRALRRAGITMRYSEGFHPKPKLSFEDALPIGIESLQERAYLSIPSSLTLQGLGAKINAHLPPGLLVNACRSGSPVSKKAKLVACTYQITVSDPDLIRRRIEWFYDQPQVLVTKMSKRNRQRRIDLRAAVKDLKMTSSRSLEATIQCDAGLTIRPDILLRHIFKLSDDNIRVTRILKKACTRMVESLQ